jgi:tetratricopeptide (TPR) repeat protein
MEPELRRIRDRYPDHWLANGRLAILYYQVGRLLDGAALHTSVIAQDPMIPGPYAFAATALSGAGRIQDADALLREAADRWPANPFIWYARYDHLLFSGRPASAAALVMDPEARPSGAADADVQPLLKLAQAVEGRQPDLVDGAVQNLTQMAQSDIGSAPFPVRNLLSPWPGRPRFRSDGALLLRPRFVWSSFADRPMTRRYTDFLFSAEWQPFMPTPVFGS